MADRMPALYDWLTKNGLCLVRITDPEGARVWMSSVPEADTNAYGQMWDDYQMHRAREITAQRLEDAGITRGGVLLQGKELEDAVETHRTGYEAARAAERAEMSDHDG